MAVTRIKVAQFADGVDGELITWDASGVPATVAVGTAGHVLTSNGTGAAPTFQATSGGSSSGIAGAVQFSGGSGAFNSDASNFFYTDATNNLLLSGGTGYNLTVAGVVSGISVTPASSITGAYSALVMSGDATGNMNLGLTNTNTSSGTSNARLSITTSAGGGDPYILLSTAEAGYVIGADNDGSDKLFIGIGSTPSSMTTSNITLATAHVGILQTTPTAKLHIGAGTATANTAPIKIDTGTALTTPEDGVIEYHSSHLYFTIGSTRYQLDQQAGGVTDADYGDVTVSGSGTVWTVDAMNFNKLTAAANTNTLDNTNFTQTWNWSTLNSTTGLTMNANGLTTGTFTTIATNNNSVNSTNGLLFVTNNGSSTSGTVAKFSSNGNINGAGLIVRANGNIGIGTNSPSAMLHLGGTPDIANGSTNGMFFRVDASGITDTTGTGTVTHTAITAFNVPVVAASSAVTYTNASTLYLAGAPSASTNVTITNGYALWVNGALKLDLGSDASGDIYYRNSAGKVTRLGVGSNGTALTLAAGIPAWTTNAVGDVVGPASSVDSEIALFNSTTGRLIKSATGTGVAVVTSGVLSTKTNPSGAFAGTTDTQTLTNKRIDPRITSTTSSTTPTPNIANEDIYILTALAGNATFQVPTGTPVQGQKLLIRIKDNATPRTLAWDAIYRAVGITLPTTTVASKTTYVGCIYNQTDTKWDAVASVTEA